MRSSSLRFSRNYPVLILPAPIVSWLFSFFPRFEKPGQSKIKEAQLRPRQRPLVSLITLKAKWYWLGNVVFGSSPLFPYFLYVVFDAHNQCGACCDAFYAWLFHVPDKVCLYHVGESYFWFVLKCTGKMFSTLEIGYIEGCPRSKNGEKHVVTRIPLFTAF